MSIPYINNLLLSLPAQGFLWLIFLFIFSFGGVHIFILAKIGAENIHKKEDAPKPKEEETKKEENFFEAFASMFKSFHPMGFVNHLSYMGIGMLGIFIIIGIIIVATVVINKAFSARTKKED